MKTFHKALAFMLLAVFIPIKQWAQTPYHAYAENGISLNFFNIDNHDFRLFLLYQLSQDERFTVIAEKENGMFVVVPTTDDLGHDFLNEFDELYNSSFASFSQLSKNDIFELFPVWKANVAPEAFTSITIDLALSRATRQNNHCVDSDPFCTSDVITFDAATSSETADQLEGVTFDDGCIGSSYSPAWYHMRINTPGQFIIHMEGHDPNSFYDRDIDFCMWGPFEDPTAPCVAQLTGDKIIDCCYSGYYDEDIYLGYPEGEHSHHTSSHGSINVHTPEVGEYYILMITNYSREACTISFTKTENSGPGTTDCGILPGIANNDGPYCTGETISLTVTTQAGATYNWTGPDGFTSNQQNPVLTDCTMAMAGTYTCVTTVDGETTSGSTEVVIFPQPNASFNSTAVCEGEATQFTSTASTVPSGQSIDTYAWDFGDGETGTGATVSHTYAQAGTYQVTHTTSNGNGFCTDEVTQEVVVYVMPIPEASANPASVQYAGVSTITADAGVDGSFSYHWEPANMVVDANSPTTQTVPLTETQVYTVTVTGNDGGCSSTAQVTVIMAGSNMTATANADDTQLCEGSSTTLHALPVAGTGNYTYSWSPANSLSNPNIQHPVATPGLGTTTYTCHVSDGIVSADVSVSITVNSNYEFELPLIEDCDEYFWDPEGHEIVATDHESPTYNQSGSYQRTYKSQYGCDSIVTMNIHFEYTPNPTPIYPIDSTNTAPHWVVTATEFQINTYEYHLWDENPNCHWDTVTWNFENDVEWVLEPFGNIGQSCRVMVLNQVEDTVWLRATAFNRCASDEGVSQRYWLVCSFYGVDENGPSTGSGTSGTFDFTVLPNPNNGQMTLNFDRLTGKVDVKVYDMRGSLIDQFETFNGDGLGTYEYQMKQATNGVYFFVATGKEGTIAKKVIIQH